jgi:hypothetical protein
MRSSQQMLACVSCKRNTLHLVREPNHLLHLLLSLITAGVWLFVWAYVAWRARNPAGRANCTVCGSAYEGRLQQDRPAPATSS